MIKKFQLFVSTARGCEQALAAEIEEVCDSLKIPLARAPGVSVAGVILEGTLEVLVALNLALTTASRVFITLKQARVRTLDDVYHQALGFNWSEHFGVEQTFAVDANCNNSFCNNSMSLALKVKDAVADSFRNKTGKRPNVDTRSPSVKIAVRLNQDQLTLSFDTSGEPLSNHGFRETPGEAPMRENLAATLVRMSGWLDLVHAVWKGDAPAVFSRVTSEKISEQSIENKRKLPAQMTLAPLFLDPMCGSGTLGIEAALILLCRKPNSRRKHFAFLELASLRTNHVGSVLETMRERLWKLEKTPAEALEACARYAEKHFADVKPPAIPVVCRDLAAATLPDAQKAARLAGVTEVTRFESGDFFTCTAPGPSGIMIVNPPYDQRIATEISVPEFYKNIGNSLKGNYGGWLTWIFSANLEGLKNIGLRPTRKLNLFSGQLPAQFQQYLITPRRAPETTAK